MTNAYYLMELSVTLTAELTQDELAELRWHLRLGPRPLTPLQVVDDVQLFYPGGGRQRGDHPPVSVDLSQREDGGWALSAWQEPEPGDLDHFEPLFRWLAERADPTTIDAGRLGLVRLGRIRFYDESEWQNEIVAYPGGARYPRSPLRPGREILPGGDSAVTTWDDFAERLTFTLARMRVGEWMTLIATGTRYAQFTAGDDGEILCEISSNNYLDESYLMSRDDQVRMTRLGWSDPGKENWTYLLRPPVTDTEYRDVAQATVSALRDVLKVSEPQQLSIRNEGYLGEQPDVSAMGLRQSQE